MLEYYFYSFVIKHEDMHTKNISTIYDIAATGFYTFDRRIEVLVSNLAWLKVANI